MSNQIMNGSKKRNEKEHVGSGAPLSDSKRSSRRKGGRAMKLAGLSSLMGVLALASLPAHAALITINENIDISGYDGGHFLVGTTPQTLALSDSVNMTVNFLPGQALKIVDSNNDNVQYSNKEAFSAVLGLDTWIGGVFENVVVTFLGFSGTEGASSTLVSEIYERSLDYLLMIGFYNFLSVGQSIQFTGYNVTYDITSLTSLSKNPTYRGMGLYSRETAVVSVPVPEAVPEPVTLSLLGIGLAGLAVARRRKASLWRGGYPA